MADLDRRSSTGWPRRLGTAGGEPVPLDGGITNRNYRVRFGERDCVLRLPGRDTELLGIDRDAERVATERAAALGIAPPLVAADDECLVTECLAGAPIDGDRLRADPSSAARALRAFHDSGLQLPVRFWVPELLDDYARIVGERGGEPTEPVPPDAGARRPDRRRAAAHRSGALSQRPAARQHPRRRRRPRARPARRLGVRRDGPPRASTSATWRSTTSSTRPPRSACSRPTSASPPEPGRRAALRLMRIVSDAREAAWGVVQGFDLRARLRLRRLRAPALRPAGAQCR